MIGIKVIMHDPGKSVDPWGTVGAQYIINKDKIQFKLAKQFKKSNYSNIAAYASKIQREIKPNFHGLETNNKGKRILRLFHEKYNLNFIHGVSTSAEMTEEGRTKGYSMDKPFMVKWFAEKLEENFFEFPDIPTKDMQELIDQIPQIVALPTPNGGTTYKAQRGRHDDLFMAALHCCNFIRLFIDQQERLK